METEPKFRAIVRSVIVITICVVVVSLGILLGNEKGALSTPTHHVVAYVAGKEIPIEVGSVIAQGSRIGDNCAFDELIEVRAIVSNDSDVAPIIRWGTDPQCRVVIKSINLVSSNREVDHSSSGVAVEPR